MRYLTRLLVPSIAIMLAVSGCSKQDDDTTSKSNSSQQSSTQQHQQGGKGGKGGNGGNGGKMVEMAEAFGFFIYSVSAHVRPSAAPGERSLLCLSTCAPGVSAHGGSR